MSAMTIVQRYSVFMFSKVLYSLPARKTFELIKGMPLIGKTLVRFANARSLGHIENTKQKLNKVSPSMCAAKWLQSTIHLGTGQTHSCPHPPRHFINAKDLEHRPSALHNTAVKIEARGEMAKGTFPKECSYCWKLEKNDEYSDRFFKSSEIWASHDFKKLVSEEAIQNINPTYLELSFSSECNLRCAYCDPNISRSIRKEIEVHGHYPTRDRYQNLSECQESEKIISSYPKPVTEYFWDWWKDLKGDLQTLRITGGEPLLAPELDELMLKFENDELPKLDFAVNSNLMIGQKRVEDFVLRAKALADNNKIKSFHLFTSIDTWVGTQNFYDGVLR